MTASTTTAQAPRDGFKFTEILALGLIALFFLVGIFGPYIIDFNPSATDTAARLKPPMTVLEGGSVAWFGTDAVGRDVAKQVIYGARVSLIVGFTAAILATALWRPRGRLGWVVWRA